MADRLRVTWQGREYQAARSGGDGGATWDVTTGGAQVTSFPAEPGDRPGEVEEKIVRWLEANEARPAQDVGRQ